MVKRTRLLSTLIQLLVLLATAAVGQEGRSFLAATASKTAPPAIAASNGKFDFVALMENDGLNVRLGNGDGTFSSGPPLLTGPSGTLFADRSVVIGDFNGDKIPDLAACNQGENTISVFLGKGDGSFGDRVVHSVGTTPNAIALIDLFHDGILDLVVANSGSDEVCLLDGGGDGEFFLFDIFDVGDSPQGLAVADLNNDTWQDIVVVNSGTPSQLSILLGQADGSFSSAPNLPSNPTGQERFLSVALADFDRDGDLDIAAASNRDNALYLFEGLGTGNFLEVGATTFTGLTPVSLSAYDFDGKNGIDIAIADNSAGNVIVLFNDGTGFLTPTGFIPSGEPSLNSLVAADIDGDGDGDLLASSFDTKAVVTMRNKGSGDFEPFQFTSLTGAPLSIAVDDLNGDRGDIPTGQLGLDDNQVPNSANDFGFAGNKKGFGWFNQLTPSSYPATLSQVRVRFSGRVSDGYQVRLVVYDDAESNGPDLDPDLPIFSRTVSVSRDADGWSTFTLDEPTEISLGSFVVGIIDDIGVGAAFPATLNLPGLSSPPGSRSFVSEDGAETFYSLFGRGNPRFFGSFLIRGVVSTGSGSAPLASTESAINVGATSATLNGTVEPNGLSTTVEFEFGPTVSYGTVVTATPSPVNGTAKIPVSAAITNLTTSTTYHFRLVAVNSAGESKGSDLTFTTISASNQPPVVANLIPNQLLPVGTQFNRDLNASPVVFSDPDGDPLSYTASSNAPGVAQAGIMGASTVNVVSIAAGNATITVTASDSKGGSVSTTFDVVVAAVLNQPPVVANAISNQNLTVGGSSFTRNLNTSPAVFTDPDGDALSYSASSSASSVATANISGSTLTVAPVAAGSATITVTANDGRGGTVSTTFTVTVATGNRAPVVANAISNQSLTVGGAPFIRDLNSGAAVFNDPDGDALVYSASSSATNIATASISISTLTVTPVAFGSATITITANDGKGGSVSTNFNVTVSSTTNLPPVISVTPVSPQPSGQQITVQANITDDVSVSSATLSFRRGGDASFTAVAMSGSGSLFQGTIPASAVTSRGVEYFVAAADGNNATTRQPATGVFSVQVQVSSESNPTAQPAGSAQTGYRLLSVPLQLNDPSPTAVLQDDLGSYDNTVWRLFGLLAGQPTSNKSPFVEFPNAGNFAPGQSLFLIVKDANKIVDAGPGQTVRTDQEFSITLAVGHNFVANPFNFDVPISKLRLQSGGAVTLRTYNGGFVTANALTPWEGYYLANNRTSADILFVNPDLSGEPQLLASKPEEGGWRLQISARCAEARDAYNFLGVAPQSIDGWDDSDWVEPPPIGEYVSVYFSHPEWQMVFDRYSQDLRSLATPNQQWDFVVESNIAGEIVRLQFDGLREIDGALHVFLVDEELDYKQNLRENNLYQFQSRGIDRPKQLTLVVGKEGYVGEQTEGIAGAPEDFVLEQNFPNPFVVGNAETMIRFGLPERSAVTIKIFDLNGREVATVFEHVELPAGRHQRVWNGQDVQGRAVPNGVYFYRLSVGSVAKTMKMVVIQ